MPSPKNNRKPKISLTYIAILVKCRVAILKQPHFYNAERDKLKTVTNLKVNCEVQRFNWFARGKLKKLSHLSKNAPRTLNGANY